MDKVILPINLPTLSNEAVVSVYYFLHATLHPQFATKNILQKEKIMNKELLIVEMPELRNEMLVGIQLFLQELMVAFESHYFCQIRQYYKSIAPCEIEDPF